MDEVHDAVSLKLHPDSLPLDEYPAGTKAYWFVLSDLVISLYVTDVVRLPNGKAHFINKSNFVGGKIRPRAEGEGLTRSRVIVLPGGTIDPTFL